MTSTVPVAFYESREKGFTRLTLDDMVLYGREWRDVIENCREEQGVEMKW